MTSNGTTMTMKDNARPPVSLRRPTAAASLLALALWLPAAGVQAQVALTCPAGFPSSAPIFEYTGAPVDFTVPVNVNSVRVIVAGADGGIASTNAFNGGSGAQIAGTFAVTPGNVLRVIAGQSGADGDFDSGGGGASGVYLNGTLAVIAGGGGGDDNTGNGSGGTATTAGSNGGASAGNSCPLGGLGGTGGAGGQFGELGATNQTCQNGSGGGGGGGLNSAGGSSALTGTPRRGPTGGAACSINGATGGLGGAGEAPNGGSNGAGVTGGFGVCGGGGSDDREGGGGGGYSGGGGGPESQFPGGGGSFLAAAATAPTLTAGTTGGGSSRNGSVLLCWPGADLQITKTNTPASGPNDLPGDTAVSGSTRNYSIVVTNNGPASANGAVIRDPVPTGLACTAATCGSAAGGAVCPAVSVAALQSTAGVTIATMPANSSLTFTLACAVQ